MSAKQGRLEKDESGGGRGRNGMVAGACGSGNFETWVASR